MSKLLSLVFLLPLFLVSCQNSAGQSVEGRESVSTTSGVVNVVLSPEAYRNRLADNPDVQLMDVRTPKEFNQGHIEGAVNVDFLNKEAFEAGVRRLDTERPVMLYCRSGRRSAKAAQQLEAIGFREIYDLRGGYLKW